MDLSSIVESIGRVDSKSDDIVDPITFIEAPWGLSLRLFPVQKVIIKAHYGIELDDNPHGYPLDGPVPKDHPEYDPVLVDEDGCYIFRIIATDFQKRNPKYLTEAGYLEFLHSEGRCNIKKVVPGKQRREMVLSVGRRSGKTLITSCIVAYETYKLLLKGNPQKYYGSSQSNVIQLISVATDRDQAGLLYREASGHFSKCGFFKPYAANATQSFATFQTPWDIKNYGSYKDNPKARYSVNVTFRSCVAKGLRGGANLLVALDEVAHFGEKGQASADEVYQAVEPSTRTFSPKDPLNTTRPIGENEGRIIMISSPLGRQGLFYKQYQLGFGNNQAADSLLCIQAPTWEVNPTVPAETFVASYLKDPNVFFTEFGAVFSDRTRGWIEREKDLIDCVNPDLRPRGRAPALSPHFMGIDVALSKDYTAIAIGHNSTDGKIVLDLVERIKAGEGDFEGYDRLEFEDVADWIHQFTKRFYIVHGIFDQWLGVPMEQALNKRGITNLESLYHSRQVSSNIYQNFKSLMLDQKLELFDWPIMDGEEHSAHIQELLELEQEVIGKYIVKVQAPQIDGKHDDFSDAIARMVWCASQNSSKVKVVSGTSNNRVLRGPVAGSGRSFGVPPMGRKLGSGRGSHPSRTVNKFKKR